MAYAFLHLWAAEQGEYALGSQGGGVQGGAEDMATRG